LTDLSSLDSAIGPDAAKLRGFTFFDWTDSVARAFAIPFRSLMISVEEARTLSPSRTASILRALLPMSLWPFWVGQRKWSVKRLAREFRRLERAWRRVVVSGADPLESLKQLCDASASSRESEASAKFRLH